MLSKKLILLFQNLCLYLLNNKDMWSSVDCPTVINQLVRVIERSSMRKPTMISADLLKHVAISIDKEVEEAKASAEDDNEGMLMLCISCFLMYLVLVIGGYLA